MNELYLSIKESVDDHVRKGILPLVNCEWDYNHIKESNDAGGKYPLLLYRLKSVVYNCPDDKYLSGEMIFTMKVLFEGQSGKELKQQSENEGFELLKKLPSLLRKVESLETGPVTVMRIENLETDASKHCYQITGSAPYYPLYNSI